MIGLQLDAVLDDVLLLLDDLVLLRVVGVAGGGVAGGHGGVQGADAVPPPRQVVRELQLRPLALRRPLLACGHMTATSPSPPPPTNRASTFTHVLNAIFCHTVYIRGVYNKYILQKKEKQQTISEGTVKMFIVQRTNHHWVNPFPRKQPITLSV